jgi:putative FmdB family regulatory protein
MPTYNAKCEKCKVIIEYIAKITDMDKDIPTCPQCEKLMERTYMGATGGFVLKGRGWFKDGGY